VVTSALRWGLKKAARRSVAFASWASGCVVRGPGSAQAPKLRVLTYHGFGDAVRDPFVVAPRAFEAQMGHLARSGLAVSLDDVEAFVTGRGLLNPGSILVTMDDGLRSVRDVALPVLRDHRIPAVAFVTASLIGVRGRSEYLDWDHLAELIDAGVEIGSHAWTHRSLGRLPAEEARDEAERSRRVLQERLAHPITAFAYPFGTCADFSPRIAQTLATCGYRIAFTSQHGSIRQGMDSLQLPRIKVEGGEGMEMFRLLVSGAMDGWQWIDRTLWRLQAAHAG
jgi:peptidoglycan/xylan/chitin deacetylase (PgdA/CDA1 family)